MNKKFDLIFLLFFSLFSFNGLAEEKVTPVSVITAKSGQLHQAIPLTGSVTSIRTSRLTPKQEGYIESMFVDKGDIVKEGAPVLELDRKLVDTEILMVKAQLAEANARDKELKRQRDEAAELVKKKHIPLTNYDAAAAEVEINNAVVKRLQAELKRQQILADRHILLAPFNGVISNKLVEVGQWIETNTALFELTELNPLRIEVPVPQFYFDRINIGTLVTIKYDAISEKLFTAEVTKKIPVSNQSTRTFPVMIRINNDDFQIAPGMSARVSFQLANKLSKESILIPRDAVIKKPDGSELVWLLEQQHGINKARPIAVKTGKSYMNNVELDLGNLNEGDQIVIKGNELLKPGQKVEVIEELDYQL